MGSVPKANLMSGLCSECRWSCAKCSNTSRIPKHKSGLCEQCRWSCAKCSNSFRMPSHKSALCEQCRWSCAECKNFFRVPKLQNSLCPSCTGPKCTSHFCTSPGSVAQEKKVMTTGMTVYLWRWKSVTKCDTCYERDTYGCRRCGTRFDTDKELGLHGRQTGHFPTMPIGLDPL